MKQISESYKKRLQEIAGIKPADSETPLILEISNEEREQAFTNSNQRVPFNKDMMIQAIKEGREVGLLFQTNNERHKMPVAKYRVTYPVAIGLSKKGNLVIRAFHKFGQSESAAQKTGKRSQEVENTWRLLKVSNIKSMWMTGNFFRGPLEAYNPNDKGMISVEVAADFNKIRKFQDDLIAQSKIDKKKNIVSLFKTDMNPPGTKKPVVTKQTQKIEPSKPAQPINKAINPKLDNKATAISNKELNKPNTKNATPSKNNKGAV